MSVLSLIRPASASSRPYDCEKMGDMRDWDRSESASQLRNVGLGVLSGLVTIAGYKLFVATGLDHDWVDRGIRQLAGVDLMTVGSLGLACSWVNIPEIHVDYLELDAGQQG